MKIIKPTTITESMLVSSTATEVYSAWSGATTYALGDKIIYGKYIYESLQAANLNKQPDTEILWWVKVSSSNKWACLDGQVSSYTAKSTSLSFTLNTGMIDSFALLNVTAASVTLTMRDGLGGTVVYTATQGLAGDVYDWYQYFFYDATNIRKSAIFRNLPPYNNAHITVDITGAADLKVGECIFGREIKFGITQADSQISITDYSRKETDDFGNVTFTKRPFSKKLSAAVWIENSSLNTVQRTLYDVRATPLVWIASDNPQLEEAMIIYGFYKDFSVAITYPSVSVCSLEIEGLI